MKIKRALLSVSDKTGIVELAKFLSDNGVEIISTGGTMKAIKEAGIPVTYVSDVTGFPEIMDGRVKTLNPKIHGAILAVRSNPEHMKALAEHDITPIDLVVVNLYPFRETVAKPGVTEAEAIEKKAEAQKKMGEASVLEMYLAALPEVVKNAAAPLAQTDKIVMYGDGNSTKMVKDVMNSTNQVIEGVKESTGISIQSLLNKIFTGKPADKNTDA